MGIPSESSSKPTSGSPGSSSAPRMPLEGARDRELPRPETAPLRPDVRRRSDRSSTGQGRPLDSVQTRFRRPTSADVLLREPAATIEAPRGSYYAAGVHTLSASGG